ncbi:hypothetical protein GVAV_001643 [Gurleya vavrai]
MLFAAQKSETRKIADSNIVYDVYNNPSSAFILHENQDFLKQNKTFTRCKDANTDAEIFDLKYNRLVKTNNHVNYLNAILRKANTTFEIDDNFKKCLRNMYDFQVFGSHCKRKIFGEFNWDKLQENAIREYFRCCLGAFIHCDFCRHQKVMPEIDFD